MLPAMALCFLARIGPTRHIQLAIGEILTALFVHVGSMPALTSWSFQLQSLKIKSYPLQNVNKFIV